MGQQYAIKSSLNAQPWIKGTYLDFINYKNVGTKDDFELEFSGSSEPELWRFRAEPSQGTSVFELKPSWSFLSPN